jgi:hypothetical protein
MGFESGGAILMHRCPNCRRTLAICLCVGIALSETIGVDAQAWCSLPPTAASARIVGEAAKPGAEFPDVATTQPGIRQLSPDQVAPAQASLDGFLQKAQVAVFVGVCAAGIAVMCLPRLPLPADTVACGIVDEIALPHIENAEISPPGNSRFVILQTATPTTFEPELRVRWRERPC